VQTIKKSLHLILFLLSLVFCLGFTHSKHPFYLSVTDLNIQTKTKLVQASCKIFTDDLQGALFNWYGKPVNLEMKSKANDSLLAVFAGKHLAVFIGKNEVPLTYLGYEIKEEAVWFYLEGKAKSSSPTIQVMNKFLCTYVSAQSNVIHCTYNESRKSYKLNCPEQEYVFRF
jgi:hypothetical protein